VPLGAFRRNVTEPPLAASHAKSDASSEASLGESTDASAPPPLPDVPPVPVVVATVVVPVVPVVPPPPAIPGGVSELPHAKSPPMNAKSMQRRNRCIMFRVPIMSYPPRLHDA
jgi:hypothetical protein